MTNTAAQAIDWMRNERDNGGAVWGGKCLMDVRISLDIGSKYGWAGLAWDYAQYKHRVTGGASCPRGVAVFWKGGSRGYGHVALSVGGGMCFSNDVRRYGHIDLVRIDDITWAWGQDFQGWTEDLNGVRYHNLEPKQSEWAKGDVYVEKLHRGSRDSNSVRRLQYRLMHHQGVPAREVRLSGNYGPGTIDAVQHWQRKVSTVSGPTDGGRLNSAQARKLFGDAYRVIN